MDLSELIEDVRSRADEDTAGFWTDTMITRWLNMANRKVSFLLECLEDTDEQNMTAGTASYALPSDYLKVKRVRADSLPLRPISMPELDRCETTGSPSTDTRGTPSHFYMWGDLLYLYPTPASSVTSGVKVTYYKRPATLIGTTDEPELPEQFQDLLVLYALHLALQRDMLYREADIILGEFRELIDEAKRYYAVNQRVEVMQIRYVED
jgi:hypothetical protein